MPQTNTQPLFHLVSITGSSCSVSGTSRHIPSIVSVSWDKTRPNSGHLRGRTRHGGGTTSWCHATRFLPAQAPQSARQLSGQRCRRTHTHHTTHRTPPLALAGTNLFSGSHGLDRVRIRRVGLLLVLIGVFLRRHLEGEHGCDSCRGIDK